MKESILSIINPIIRNLYKEEIGSAIPWFKKKPVIQSTNNRKLHIFKIIKSNNFRLFSLTFIDKFKTIKILGPDFEFVTIIEYLYSN